MLKFIAIACVANSAAITVQNDAAESVSDSGERVNVGSTRNLSQQQGLRYEMEHASSEIKRFRQAIDQEKNDLRQAIKKLQQQKIGLQQDIENHSHTLEGIKSESDRLKNEISKMQGEKMDLRKKLKQQRDWLNNTIDKKKLLKEKIKDLEKSVRQIISKRYWSFNIFFVFNKIIFNFFYKLGGRS